MPFDSIDKLQNALAEKVFGDRKDSKKASGRALGTFVEIISFYLLESWDLSRNIAIETRLIEYGNPSIAHNVEYTLHPVRNYYSVALSPISLPITSAKLTGLLHGLNRNRYTVKNNTLLSRRGILRNSCLIGKQGPFSYYAAIEKLGSKTAKIRISEQYPKPFAMVECKRVGVEEGMRKGRQTIEKAKQGAYVAKAVSSLQRIRRANGKLYGLICMPDGTFYAKPYEQMIVELLNSRDPALYSNFILTIGVVSNHGNWFTSNNPNKEMLVLAQAYDWLVFLTDAGICEFIEELLIHPENEYEHVRDVFLASYGQVKNQFTKVQMEYKTHLLLLKYFKRNYDRIARWFNIITPDSSLYNLRDQLQLLTLKDWSGNL
ncbi:MAG: hypothetical protein ABSF24_09135 [Candidatus Bathyarchaeia archaeon]|jgi:hypothetical protein